ncbi:hypothetical protein [Trichloromonas acetexigens]|jgi:hypothetical protein|uniref:Lipoprotein n=1 Tax=Trichloromonas acetexigens TaxID=38815 RepID=A0A550JBE4_9BACT|nr:hypothetical protein [Desulfuromonas acetexigens]TRO80580.1 hypothetical protein FL622_10845 [Desulfuromonas acetexigens]
MKKLRKLFIPLLALTLSACTAPSGLSSAKADAVREYPTLALPGGSVSISTARAYGQGEGLMISGRLKRLHELPMPGHMDLVICTPDGTRLAQEQIRVAGLSSKRRGLLELPFRTHLPLTPPAGAVIHLRYHAPTSPDGELDCPHS